MAVITRPTATQVLVCMTAVWCDRILIPDFKCICDFYGILMSMPLWHMKALQLLWYLWWDNIKYDIKRYTVYNNYKLYFFMSYNYYMFHLALCYSLDPLCFVTERHMSYIEMNNSSIIANKRGLVIKLAIIVRVNNGIAKETIKVLCIIFLMLCVIYMNVLKFEIKIPTYLRKRAIWYSSTLFFFKPGFHN